MGITSNSIIDILNADDPERRLTLRICGTSHVLMEYSPVRLDLRKRAHLYRVEQILRRINPEGMREITGGVSALLISYSYKALKLEQLIEILRIASCEAEKCEKEEICSREVYLPIAFHDKQGQAAVEKYIESIRSEAPYLPDNLEFLAMCNGLAGAKEVEKAILSTEYLVLGLGDVYMGAPCAVPLDPRYRLCAPKYNPPRTHTPIGAVGIGGSFLSIYPIVSPGGYQLVGRTVPIWNKHQLGAAFKEAPWLLRPFDRIHFYAVNEPELDNLCDKVMSGNFHFRIKDGLFDLNYYSALWDRTAELPI